MSKSDFHRFQLTFSIPVLGFPILSGFHRHFCGWVFPPWIKSRGWIRVRLDKLMGDFSMVKSPKNVPTAGHLSMDRKPIPTALSIWKILKRSTVLDHSVVSHYSQPWYSWSIKPTILPILSVSRRPGIQGEDCSGGSHCALPYGGRSARRSGSETGYIMDGAVGVTLIGIQ